MHPKTALTNRSDLKQLIFVIHRPIVDMISYIHNTCRFKPGMKWIDITKHKCLQVKSYIKDFKQKNDSSYDTTWL